MEPLILQSNSLARTEGCRAHYGVHAPLGSKPLRRHVSAPAYKLFTHFNKGHDEEVIRYNGIKVRHEHTLREIPQYITV